MKSKGTYFILGATVLIFVLGLITMVYYQITGQQLW